MPWCETRNERAPIGVGVGWSRYPLQSPPSNTTSVYPLDFCKWMRFPRDNASAATNFPLDTQYGPVDDSDSHSAAGWHTYLGNVYNDGLHYPFVVDHLSFFYAHRDSQPAISLSVNPHPVGCFLPRKTRRIEPVVHGGRAYVEVMRGACE